MNTYIGNTEATPVRIVGSPRIFPAIWSSETCTYFKKMRTGASQFQWFTKNEGYWKKSCQVFVMHNIYDNEVFNVPFDTISKYDLEKNTRHKTKWWLWESLTWTQLHDCKHYIACEKTHLDDVRIVPWITSKRFFVTAIKKLFISASLVIRGEIFIGKY